MHRTLPSVEKLHFHVSNLLTSFWIIGGIPCWGIKSIINHPFWVYIIKDAILCINEIQVHGKKLDPVNPSPRMISNHTSLVVSNGSTFTCVWDQESQMSWSKYGFVLDLINKSSGSLSAQMGVFLSCLLYFLTVITWKWKHWKQQTLSCLFFFLSEGGCLTFKPIWWLLPFTPHPVSPMLLV